MRRGAEAAASGLLRTSAFARALLREWRRLALPEAAEQSALLAVSGGADSTALLLAFDELLVARLLDLKITVAHLDHGLRGEAGEQDAQWVEELVAKLGYAFVLERTDVNERALRERANLEQTARRARYEFLASAAHTFGAAFVLTAHTADDQAETVLLNLLRGGGAGGLGGMRPVRELSVAGDAPNVRLARPLLAWARRAATQKYCLARGVEFRRDAMNDDATYARVRARRQLIPLLETFNPRAVEALTRGAELLREDAAILEELAAQLLRMAKLHAPGAEDSKVRGATAALSVKTLAAARPALRRRALRQWIAEAQGDLRKIQLSHILALEKLLDGKGGRRTAELPGDYSVTRHREELRIMFKTVDKDVA